jgi:hypothetical protein
MNWEELLEPVLPGMLEFLEAAMSKEGGNPRSGPEKMTAAVNLSHCALEIAGVPLPSRDQVGNVVQSAVNKMKSEEKLGGLNEQRSPVDCRPHVGEIDQPS